MPSNRVPNLLPSTPPAGMAAAFLTHAPGPPVQQPAEAQPAPDGSSAQDGRGGAAAQPAADAGAAAAEAAGPAVLAAAAPPPLLSYVGVGEAGWGCAGAAQAFRGCKWTAHAGLVLQLPDHAAQQAHQAQAAAAPGAGSAGTGGSAVGSDGGGGAAEGPARGLPPPTPVFVFRSWAMQLEEHAPALKGLSMTDWPAYGFLLEQADVGTGGCRGHAGAGTA